MGDATQQPAASSSPPAAPDPLRAFFAGQLAAVCVRPDGRIHVPAAKPTVLLPGSFNPLHEGHVRLARVAAAWLGTDTEFELSVVNADKPPLEPAEVRRRLRPFAWRAPVWLTRAPTFREKAQLFPGATFVVGADTAARIVQQRFYGHSAAQLNEALTELRDQHCRFLVAGRVDACGRFLALDDLPVPDAARDLFTALPPSQFRLDLSSTQLRAADAPRPAPTAPAASND